MNCKILNVTAKLVRINDILKQKVSIRGDEIDSKPRIEFIGLYKMVLLGILLECESG